MNRKFLDDIGVSKDNRTDLWNLQDSRQGEWAQERSLYGFDERESWDLRLTFYAWLYERVKYYYEFAGGVNLEHHSINHKGIELTQRECIEKILEGCKTYLLARSHDDFSEDERIAVAEVAEIWSAILPCMWW